jgi:23S rRNA (adenine2030-N6)-methyltransferase
VNYRHIFHAGNICDTVKHSVLALAIASLRVKEKGFCILDSHAGAGLYDLQDERAVKTGEAQKGILRLLQAPAIPGLADYYRILGELNSGVDIFGPGTVRYYPGSPVIARHMLRPQDRLVLCELHEEEFGQLKRQFRHDAQTQIHHRDGYKALAAFLPPAEKRGLALIDPPFEDTEEFARLAETLKKIHARWREGSVIVWYPVKDRPAIWRFHEALIATGIPEMLCAEFIYDEETRGDRLNGCGFILVNAPWQLDEKLSALFPALHRAFGTTHRGVTVKRLKP